MGPANKDSIPTGVFYYFVFIFIFIEDLELRRALKGSPVNLNVEKFINSLYGQRVA
jgi:hypothetical protein